MFSKLGGVKWPRAKLNIQFAAVVIETALPRTRRGKSPGG
jgi:hypothetical protein